MRYSTEEVWEEFSSVILTFIRRRVSNPSHIDDILQDVFTKIHQNIDTLENSVKIRSWIFQIARNTIIDYYRKQKTKTEDIDTLLLEDKDTVLGIDEIALQTPAQEIAMGLKGMIETLPEKYAQALMLVEFEGLSQVELSQKLGISVSGAKSRVQRGRQLLKDSLMKCCHFEFDRFGTIIDFHPICCCCCHCH